MKKKVTVLGAGSFGIALAKAAAQKGHTVSLWSRREEIALSINNKRCHPQKMRGICLPEEVVALSNLKEALAGAHMVIFALPMIALRKVLDQAKSLIDSKSLLLSTTKGIEQETLLFPSQIIAEIVGKSAEKRCVTLSGPSFALELASDLPTYFVVASQNLEAANVVKKLLERDCVNLKTSKDVIGVEVCGAYKNVIAIAAGLIDGLKLGSNAKAALVTKGLDEITRVVLSLKGSKETIYGVSGVGDLALTCYGSLSRNRFIGQELARGCSIDEILPNMNEVPEGVYTAKSFKELVKRNNVTASILSSIYDFLYKEQGSEDNTVRKCIDMLK